MAVVYIFLQRQIDKMIMISIVKEIIVLIILAIHVQSYKHVGRAQRFSVLLHTGTKSWQKCFHTSLAQSILFTCSKSQMLFEIKHC